MLQAMMRPPQRLLMYPRCVLSPSLMGPSIRSLLWFQIQDLHIFARVDNTTYSIIGLARYPNSTKGDGVSANITNRIISPTQIITVATAGPMQVNVTFLNPVEVRFQPSNTSISAPTYVPSQAGRLGQAIDTLFIHFSLCDIPRQCSS